MGLERVSLGLSVLFSPPFPSKGEELLEAEAKIKLTAKKKKKEPIEKLTRGGKKKRTGGKHGALRAAQRGAPPAECGLRSAAGGSGAYAEREGVGYPLPWKARLRPGASPNNCR